MNASIIREDTHTSAVMKSFLAISPMEIRSDLGVLEDRADGWRSLENTFQNSRNDDPDEMARSFHRRLLLGVHLTRVSMLPKDLILFIVTLTAHEIAELACSAASGRGQLFQLSEELERLEELGDWDHTSADVVLSDSLIERIHDSVFLEVLHRYGLRKPARLYEEKRAIYDICCEVGRRLVTGNPVSREEHEASVRRIRSLHGSKSAEIFVSRLARNDLLPD
jgi:hypothetical protein